jgi:large subunit ribosomal protein L22
MAAVETRSEVRAEARYVRTAPRKAQLVVDKIRGRSVPEARTILAFMTRDAANDVRKVLDSAAANAEANHGLVSDELYVVSAFVGAGPTLKRWRPRARGRVGRIKKRTCHIVIGLASTTGEAIPEPIERPAPVTLTEEPEPIVVDETGAEVEAVEEPTVEEAPAEEQPKRTRAPRKEAAEAETAEADAAEEKPKPRRTRAAKPKAEAEQAEPEADAPAAPRASRKKKTTETETDEGSDT